MWLERWHRKLFYWFGFSRRESDGFLMLLILIIVLLAIPPIFDLLTENKGEISQISMTKVDGMALSRLNENSAKPDTGYGRSEFNSKKWHAEKPFDPNNITVEEIIAMGFSEQVASRWVKYRNKGGRFRIKSDVKKLYGFPADAYELLQPFIQLPDSLVDFKQRDGRKFEDTQPRYSKPKFDLNKVDSAQLLELYGIGQALARRIIRYRERLGGFISFDQLYEVFALDSHVVEVIKQRSYISPDYSPRKVFINRLSDDNLSDHPYLGRKLSRILANYKLHHGPYHRPEDLLNTSLITPEKLSKLTPYLDFSE